MQGLYVRLAHSDGHCSGKLWQHDSKQAKEVRYHVRPSLTLRWRRQVKICVFGASGKTGKHLVEMALAQGSEVLAVARQVSSISARGPSVTAIAADVLVADSLAFLQGHKHIDHVIVALGSKALKADPVRTEGTLNILAALKQAGLAPRVSLISAAGCHQSWQQLTWVSKLFAKLLLPAVMREHEAQEQALINSGLPYTIFRPSGLVDKKANLSFQLINSGKMKPATIERTALASCILSGLDNDTWVNKALTVTGQA